MKLARYLFLVVIIWSLAACEAVITKQPLGEEVLILDSEIWQGMWLGNEVVLLTTVLDSENGVLQAAWVERGADGAKIESFTGTIRKTGDWKFLNLLNEHPAEEITGSKTNDQNKAIPSVPEYFWARVENDGKLALLWWPNVEQIRQAVNENRLPGTIKEDNDVLLEALNKAQLELINSPGADLLKWSEPAVFIRIGD